MSSHTGSPSLAVVGLGTMGRGIAQVAAESGFTVLLHDLHPDAVQAAMESIRGVLERRLAKARISRADFEATLARLIPCGDLANLGGCEVVIESIVESLEAKRDLFRRLESVVCQQTLLATNTSSLSVTAVAAGCAHPQRVVGWHFFNPVPLVRVTEIVRGLRTMPEATARIAELAAAMGMVAVQVQDMPGFIVNHAGRAFTPEAFRMLSEGVAEFHEIDCILKDAGGFRMGPFELIDMIGLDVAEMVMDSLYHQYYEEPRFRSSPLVRQRVAAGLLGRKSGQGFYDYPKGTLAPIPPSATPQADLASVWVSGAETELAERLRTTLSQEGVHVVQDPQPGDDDLIVVTPLGQDVSKCATDQGLDARRTVGVDTLPGMDRRRTLMCSPATTAAWRDRAHATLAAGGVPVTVIRDSPGFVYQRMAALIVAIGCDMAQQRIAEPEDIDRAVRAALGYPQGPLAMGDALGPRKVVKILRNMHEAYGDPRYRPCPWLERRARLGMSLLQSD